MLDLIATFCFAIFFGLGIAYTHGCDYLKGTRP
jgi:hypothetical protein